MMFEDWIPPHPQTFWVLLLYLPPRFRPPFPGVVLVSETPASLVLQTQGQLVVP